MDGFPAVNLPSEPFPIVGCPRSPVALNYRLVLATVWCVAIPRHKTAIRRAELSRPIGLGLREGLITSETRVLDYGCGHGTDVRLLKKRGVAAMGWDPVHHPKGTKAAANVVNLGYVLNVIEDPVERVGVLADAWSFADQLLIVSGRLDVDARRQNEGVAYSDGCLTGLGTFQKFFQQQELRELITATLGVEPAAAAPGVFFVFRDPAQRDAFIASRFHRTASEPKLRRSDVLFDRHKEDLQRLMTFVSHRGRVPEADELANGASLADTFGSIKKAFAVVRRVTGKEPWEDLRELRKQDMLVFLGLAAFPRRPRYSELSPGIQKDVRALFGSYKKARSASDALLFSAGDGDALRTAARSSDVGKKMPEAIYVHVNYRELLPPVLRVYEGCARVLIGAVPDATLIKLRLNKPQVSYLEYESFDRDPHPSLLCSTSVNLGSRRIRRRRYSQDGNPPILHRKEDFVPESYPGREKFARLTRQEESWALYANPSEIGTRDGWNGVLERTGLKLRGHRLVRKKAVAATSEPPSD